MFFISKNLVMCNCRNYSLSKTSFPCHSHYVFDGDPANYYNFLRSFTNLIETKTNDSKKRLHYLVQYTRGANFATSGNNGHLPDINNKQPGSAIGSTVTTRLLVKCSFCNGHHVLVRCKDFMIKKLSVEQRLQFVRSTGLCVNCLLSGHFVRECPKSSFCKVSGCQSKHSTYLHPQSDPQDPEDHLVRILMSMKCPYQTAMVSVLQLGPANQLLPYR